MSVVYIYLSLIMDWCYRFLGNYGLAIVLFTFISKIVLLPVSIWVQKNSIKMVKMQPELNEIKAAHFGDKDMIAELNAEVYKREKYNAFASIFPMVIQVALLIALIEVIKEGVARTGVNTSFLGVSLEAVPGQARGAYLLVPFIAGAAAYALCLVQNKVNVLQSNSSFFEKYFTMAVSVGLSLYLGFLVQVGVIIYWIFSNLFGILQIFFLNWIIDPRKYVDYERLEKSRKELEELENLDKKKEVSKEDRRREKADYKRFFSIGNKHLVFYSESNGFYKYFKGVIEYILENTNIVIHYITSDPKDNIFKMAETNPQIKAYFIGEKKLITLMMKMDADVVVMTTPDLENYHIKRSYVRKDIEYIYIQHHVGSINMILRKGAVDNFDTVLISGEHQKEEIRKTEEVYGLKAKNLVEYGYPLLDEMISEYERKTHKDGDKQKMILIAPSWHSQGIMFTCIDELLDGLKESSYKVVLRPHPQFVRHNRQNLEVLSNKYKDYENVDIQFDFTSNNPVLDADIVVTDWSAIAYEYAFTTLKPVLYVDAPMKVNNPEYEKVPVVPIDVWIRDKTGARINPEDAGKALDVIESLWAAEDKYKDDILRIRSENIYNLGHSAEVAADYIIGVIQDKASSRKAEKEGKKANKSA